jgi:glutamate dehydrogenase
MAAAERDAGVASAEAARAAVDAWAAQRPAAARAVTDLIDAIEREGDGWSFAKLTIAGGTTRQLAATAQPVV